MGLRSFFCFGPKKDPKETQRWPAATLKNISYPLHVQTTNPIGEQYTQHFTASSRPLRRPVNERREGGRTRERRTEGGRGERERKRRSDMSFSCVGAGDSYPLPLPPERRYTGSKDKHPSILAPTDWGAWVPPPGMKLKTDVICFSCRKAPGRDDIGLCKQCKRFHPPHFPLHP
ncbi:hypothetical protein L873DRAFT_1394471 [Choiromyces venosus 120613-1]|uniref:Uncharacterized protein n=1 Tax=Choiromyces venosus 120613-1 TaxID=1336337 RepID=A0A3N4J918_9PEZI|nr:hypothetical protein L873DRAFT_1394471 [Choiromyces venosus 120613-1]